MGTFPHRIGTRWLMMTLVGFARLLSGRASDPVIGVATETVQRRE